MTLGKPLRSRTRGGVRTPQTPWQSLDPRLYPVGILTEIIDTYPSYLRPLSSLPYRLQPPGTSIPEVSFRQLTSLFSYAPGSGPDLSTPTQILYKYFHYRMGTTTLLSSRSIRTWTNVVLTFLDTRTPPTSRSRSRKVEEVVLDGDRNRRSKRVVELILSLRMDEEGGCTSDTRAHSSLIKRNWVRIPNKRVDGVEQEDRHEGTNRKKDLKKIGVTTSKEKSWVSSSPDLPFTS